MLEQGKQLFAQKIDFNTFQSLFNKIIDTSFEVEIPISIHADEEDYYSLIINYYVQKIIEKEEFSELDQEKYQDSLKISRQFKNIKTV